jgi:hypothetical protein
MVAMDDPVSEKRHVLFYVEVPQDCTDSAAELEKRLRASRLLVTGWEDFGFRAEVEAVRRVEDADPEALAPLMLELLRNFSPFISAWEAKNPWASDGEDLALRMKAALGLPPDWDEEDERPTAR